MISTTSRSRGYPGEDQGVLRYSLVTQELNRNSTATATKRPDMLSPRELNAKWESERAQRPQEAPSGVSGRTGCAQVVAVNQRAGKERRPE